MSEAMSSPSLSAATDEDTVKQSGNPTKRQTMQGRKKKSSSSSLTAEEKVAKYKAQIGDEKAGKRKLFHSLVKLANELRRVRTEATPLMEQRNFEEQPWHQGGIWRAPALLPGAVTKYYDPDDNDEEAGDENPESIKNATARYFYRRSNCRLQAVSLSMLYFSLVIVTALTRVGVVISRNGRMDLSQTFYFAIFFSIWTKESAYSTRFDTSDLSATLVTFAASMAVLFGSLSVAHPINADESSVILLCAAFCAGLHVLLHIRVALTGYKGVISDGSNGGIRNTENTTTTTPPELDANAIVMSHNVAVYAMLNTFLCTLEMALYLIAVFVFDASSGPRWMFVLLALLSSIRAPRAFLTNDFHASCAQRSVLFILLLGFLLQSIVVVASQFFEYQSPSLGDYSFFGATCVLFFCVKLLHEDDDSLTEDHALLVHRAAGFWFNFGQFTLTLSTTVMGSGLNNMTHEYLAATVALPEASSKQMVCGGFAMVLLSIVLVKSLHRKRVPTSPRSRSLFMAAYAVQAICTLLVVVVATYLAWNSPASTGWLGYIMSTDAKLLWGLAGSAILIVLVSWLDEGVELALYQGAEEAFEFRVNPLSVWCCLKQPGDSENSDTNIVAGNNESTSAIIRNDQRLSQLSPLLGSDLSDMKSFAYDSVPKSAV